MQVSSSQCVLIHEVIPFMDILTDYLDKFYSNTDLPPIVHAAAYQGQKMLDQYYTYMDNSIIFCIMTSAFY